MKKFFLFSFILLLSGCHKTITHKGNIWYEPDDKKQEKEYNDKVFIKTNNEKDNSKQNVSYQYNAEQYKKDNPKAADISEIEKQLNKNAQISQLAEKEGQVKLTNRDDFSKKEIKQEPVKKEPVVEKKEVKQPEVKKETLPPVKKSYKIQCGNYLNEKSAQKVASKIRAAGVKDVNIVTENGTSKILVGDFVQKEEGQAIFDKINSLNLKDAIFWSYK